MEQGDVKKKKKHKLNETNREETKINETEQTET